MKKIIFLLIGVLALLRHDAAKAQGNLPLGSIGPASIDPSTTYYTFEDYNSSQPFINYTRAYVPRFPTISLNLSSLPSKVGTVTTFTNGWGEKLETTTKLNSLTTDYLIQPYSQKSSLTSFDFLPFPYSYNGSFITTPINSQISYYTNSSNPLSVENGYSFSKSTVTSDDDVVYHQTYRVGSDLVGQSVGTTSHNYFNGSSDNILIWNLDGSGDPTSPGNYDANEIKINSTTGADAEVTKEYTNSRGQLVCKKVHTGSDWLVTYYVYDDFGKLVWILTPKFMDTYISSVLSTPLTNLCYHYKYNQNGDVIEKRVPDQDGVFSIVYDSKRRPILSQSPLMAANDQWQYTIYDGRNRPVMGGLMSSSSSRASLQAYYDNPGSLTTGSLDYYLYGGLIGSYPSSPSFTVDIYNYYDDYDDLPSPLSGRSFTTSYSSDYLVGTPYETPQAYNGMTNGFLIGSKVRVLDPGSSTEWNYTINFYDLEGRVIQTQSHNYLQSDPDIWDISTNQYDFTGNLVLNILDHKAWSGASPTPVKIMRKYLYDYNNGRLTSVMQKVTNRDWAPIAAYEYNSMGQVKTKTLGGVEVQDYKYNIRGQMASMNENFLSNMSADDSRHFGEAIGYENGFTYNRLDGSISGFIWRTSSTYPRAYGYLYDGAGRMTQADFNQRKDPSVTWPTGTTLWSHSVADYSVSGIVYDGNGNMQSMVQKGMALVGGTVQPVTIDDLTYSYKTNSNRLDRIDDGASYHINDFTDNSNTATNEYGYDADGNLTRDDNKGIDDISYNHLDLPVSVTKGSNSIDNIYDAAGNLLQKTVVDGSTTDVYRYWGPFTYKNNVLQFFLHDEGRSRWLADSSFFKDEFFLKDHLGNVRAVIAADVQYGATSYSAGYELRMANVEEGVFDHIGDVRELKPSGTPNVDVMCARLNGSESDHRIGAAMMLHGMEGDEISLSVFGYYETMDSATLSTYASPEAMVGALISTLEGGVTGDDALEGAGDIGTGTVESLLSAPNYAAYEDLKANATDPDFPRSYLNFLVFDDYNNLIPEQSQVVQLKGTPSTWTEVTLVGTKIALKQNGTVIEWISNETPDNTFYDNTHLQHFHGRLLQEDNYYPHGLHIEDVASTVSIKNNYLYQTKKLQDELGIDLYDFHARQYDAQIGRFWGTDPADQFPSGYTGMGNDPANDIDPTGMVAHAPWAAGENHDFDYKFWDKLPIQPDYWLLFPDLQSTSFQTFWEESGILYGAYANQEFQGYGSGKHMNEVEAQHVADGESAFGYVDDMDVKTGTDGTTEVGNHNGGDARDFMANVVESSDDPDCKIVIPRDLSVAATTNSPTSSNTTTYEFKVENPNTDGTKMWCMAGDGAKGSKTLEHAETTNAALGTATTVQNETVRKAGLEVAESAKVTGKLFDVAAVALSLADIKMNGLNAENGTDLFANGCAFVPGGGWVVGVTFTLAKWSTNMLIRYMAPPQPRFIDSPIPNPSTNRNFNPPPLVGGKNRL